MHGEAQTSDKQEGRTACFGKETKKNKFWGRPWRKTENKNQEGET